MPKEPTLKQLIQKAKALGIDYTEMNYDEMLAAVEKAEERPKTGGKGKTSKGEAKTPAGRSKPPKKRKKKVQSKPTTRKPKKGAASSHWNDEEEKPEKPKGVEKPPKKRPPRGKGKTINKGTKPRQKASQGGTKAKATKPRTKTRATGAKKPAPKKGTKAPKRSTRKRGRGRPPIEMKVPKGNPFRDGSTAHTIMDAVHKHGKEGAIKALDKSKKDFAGKEGAERTAYIRYRVYCTIRDAQLKAKKG